MKVQGKIIDQEVIDACIARMRSGKHFRAHEIEYVAEMAGISRFGGDAMRVADRIIQRERKAGTIQFIGSQQGWKWVGS